MDNFIRRHLITNKALLTKRYPKLGHYTKGFRDTAKHRGHLSGKENKISCLGKKHGGNLCGRQKWAQI